MPLVIDEIEIVFSGLFSNFCDKINLPVKSKTAIFVAKFSLDNLIEIEFLAGFGNKENSFFSKSEVPKEAS